MKITYLVRAYNDRRYSRPWIAKVTNWPIGKNPTLKFGGCLDKQNAEIEVEEGDLLKYGQKDNRNPGKSINLFYQVKAGVDKIEEGEHDLDITASEAREIWGNQTPQNPLAKYTTVELETELASRKL